MKGVDFDCSPQFLENSLKTELPQAADLTNSLFSVDDFDFLRFLLWPGGIIAKELEGSE